MLELSFARVLLKGLCHGDIAVFDQQQQSLFVLTLAQK